MADEIKDALESLTKKLDGKFDASAIELKKLGDEIAKQEAAHAAEVQKLNDEFKSKDAKLIDLQNEVKEIKAKKMSGGMSGKAITIKDILAETILEHKDAIMKSEKGPMTSFDMTKTVGNIASANLSGTGNNYISYLDWKPGMEPTGQIHFRDFVRTIQSDTDFVRYPRANSPIGEGSFGFIAEAAAKPQVDRDYTMIDLTLKALAGYAIVSRQSLRNIKFLQSWLPTSMLDQLRDQEDSEFANTLVAAATGSTSGTGITNGTTNIGKLVSSITRAIQAKYNPNAIALDPAAWASLLLNTETNAGYNLPNVVTIDPSGNVRVLGRVTTPVNWLTGGRFIVGDWTKAAIVESEGLTMRQSDSHSSIFTTNEVAFLLEVTEGLAIYRVNAFASSTFS